MNSYDRVRVNINLLFKIYKGSQLIPKSVAVAPFRQAHTRFLFLLYGKVVHLFLIFIGETRYLHCATLAWIKSSLASLYMMLKLD